MAEHLALVSMSANVSKVLSYLKKIKYKKKTV